MPWSVSGKSIGIFAESGGEKTEGGVREKEREAMAGGREVRS